MEKDKEEKGALIRCSMNVTLVDEKGKQVSTGECEGIVDEEYLTIYPRFGDILPFHLRDVVDIEAGDYRITLSLDSKEKLIIHDLGFCFEDFLRVLTDQRNEVTIRDLLMNEKVRRPDVSTEFVSYDDKGTENLEGSGKVRLYETALVIIPQRGEIVRLPYGDIVGISVKDYTVTLAAESGGKIVLQRMGSDFDPFVKALSDANDDLQHKAVELLEELLPGLDSRSLRRIAALMREGKAARRSDIESIDPKAFQYLEKKVESAGLGESYSFLKKLSRQDKICIGYKRGLMGDLTGEYIWFLVPIYGAAESSQGNAIAMEAAETTGDESTGKATYFFRIVDRKDYLSYELNELDKETDRMIRMLNRCMIDINFRREPIYLPEERLEEAQYLKYKIAVKRLPLLRLLRQTFVGRVIHSSPEQWKRDVEDLLSFNSSVQDDSAKWRR